MLVATAAAALTLGATGCDKSKSKSAKTEKTSKGGTGAVKPAPGGDKAAAGDKKPAEAAKATKPEAPPTAANPQGAPPATPPAGGGDSVTALPGGPALQVNPVAGLDLASASAGVLTNDLRFGPGKKVSEDGEDSEEKVAPKPASSNQVDDSLVPVKKDAERNKVCQKLLDCTKEALLLAPGSVTSYNVTRESVDSLEPDEAEGECKSDLKDLVDVLVHEKKTVPKVCK